MNANSLGAVAEPTWYGEIRHMFTTEDVEHMATMGLDLTSYAAVKASSGAIYGQVATGRMPPSNPWSEAQTQTFLNWMTNGHPKGAETEASSRWKFTGRPRTASRIRKDVRSLDNDEIELLVKAFEGLMARDPKSDTDEVHPNSYFRWAGIHWLPGPDLLCQHHVPAYNPWHRAYLFGFENALRSVPDCEGVTLPYWDITTPFPDLLKAPPFDRYTLPRAVGSDRFQSYDKGYTTQRFPYDQIADELAALKVTADVQRALTEPDWEDFHGYWADATYNTIIAAHDSGHVAVGPTLSRQSVAAFDPVFWFFHCNWDRLWWEWQVAMEATTLDGLLSTIDRERDLLSYQIFTLDPLKELNPFTNEPPHLITTDVIDSEGALDVDYADPVAAPPLPTLTAKTMRFAVSNQAFSVQAERVNVSVKGVNRLAIPGSFRVHLLKDNKRIATRAMFQPAEPERCPTCIKNGTAHFDFELPLAAVQGGTLSVEVEPVEHSVVGPRFPHKLMGSPTVHVELLVQTE